MLIVLLLARFAAIHAMSKTLRVIFTIGPFVKITANAGITRKYTRRDMLQEKGGKISVTTSAPV